MIPPHASQHSIERFITTNQTWISQRKSSLIKKIDITDGAQFMFHGQTTTIRITHHAKKTTSIKHDDNTNTITISTARDDPSSNFKRWIIENARSIIEPMAQSKAQTIHHSISKIDLRDTSSRWGSCSSDGRLMLSWRLVLAPPYVLDYVVGHEVAHLKHMDHGKQFWALCYSLCDKPDDARAWLKHNGNHLLNIF